MKVVTYQDYDPEGAEEWLIIEVPNPMTPEPEGVRYYGACSRTVEYR